MDTVNFVKKLMSIPSPSGKEAKIGIFIAKRLRKNFKVKLQKVGKNFNILASVGEPKLILTTHLDTVPGELKIKENSKYLYGRGSCDAKGILASMIVAGEKAVKHGYNNFGLLFDVDEEGNFSGIKKALNLINPEFVIIGEPTGLEVITGQKGLISLQITCKGKAVSGAIPEKGISAINELMDILQKIRGVRFTKGTSVNIGKISGGISSNVVPDLATSDIEIRTVGSNKKCLSIIRKCVGKAKLKFISNYEPVTSNSPFEISLGVSKKIAPYFTEMFFWSKKSKVVIFGAGDYAVAHSTKEKIKKTELKKSIDIYFQMIRGYAVK